ncbi:MAG: 4-hydroxy-tetrahydrodipicolinate synthase [Fimbriimonadaceae bacterium]
MSFPGPKDWGRLLTAMITPFKNGQVNYDEAQRVAAYLVDDMKNDGVVVSGTTGESPTLSSEEKIDLVKAVLEAVGDRASVVFGAGSYNTAESIEMAQRGEQAGAHGIMLVNPYYSKPGQEGLYQHFKAVAEAVDSPVMLYNIKPRSAINLQTETLLRLAEVDNIVAVKEASGDMKQMSEVCARTADDFRVYSGDDPNTLPLMSVGGYGLVSVSSHVAGPLFRTIIDKFLERDTEGARKAHQEALPIVSAMFSAPSPSPVKYALSKQGFDCAEVRLPIVPLDKDQEKVVDAALGRLMTPAS